MNQVMDPQAAHDIVLGIHKRAFLGRLEQFGIVPENEKEAAALLDLGWSLFQHELTGEGAEKQASAVDYGDGPFAHAKRALDELTASAEVAPGFPAKQASAEPVAPLPEVPSELVEAAYNAAYDLAHDPAVYTAAIVKRAANEALYAELLAQEAETEKEPAPAE